MFVIFKFKIPETEQTRVNFNQTDSQTPYVTNGTCAINLLGWVLMDYIFVFASYHAC